MSALDMLARAEVSSDLSHKEYLCDVDVLAAAGLSSTRNFAHLSIFRLKYLNDAAEITTGKRLFIQWARIAMLKHKINPASASRVGVHALSQWIDDTCHACRGVKHAIIPGTPALSARVCPHCHGSGKNPVKAESAALVGVYKDLRDRADAVCESIRRGVKGRLE